jgi:hypothetical protein
MLLSHRAHTSMYSPAFFYEGTPLHITQRMRIAPCRSLRASPHLSPLRYGKRRILWKRYTP